MVERLQSDVVVVGGGLAGLVAANRAAELGLAVIVLEQGSGEDYACNSRFAGGFFHVAQQDVRAPSTQLYEAIRAATAGMDNASLAQALAADAGRAIAWLEGKGAQFSRLGPRGYESAVLTPPGLRQTGLHWKGLGGDMLLRSLEANLRRLGGTLHRGTRAVRLLVDDGRCVGVATERGGQECRIEGRAVVLADGGFQGSPDMLRQAISPRPDLLVQRGAGTGRGDGIRMAADIGARIVGLAAFYGHVQHRDALKSEALWPYPTLDMLATTGLVVDRQGRRFCDEGRGGIAIANAIAKLQDPASVMVVFDRPIWEGPGREYILPANPHLVHTGAPFWEAGDLDALARKADIDPAGLNETVAAYNRAVVDRTLHALSPARSAGLFGAYAVADPPFYAAPACAGITYTLGGILIDADARVVDEKGNAMPGLFAAGSTTGGLEGGPHAGYVGGLCKAVVFGLRAAEWITQSARA